VLHGLIPILPPPLFKPQSLDGAPKKEKGAIAMDGALQFSASAAIFPILSEVLHHSPLINVHPVGQRQNALVGQRSFDLWQILAHPIGRVFPIAALSDGCFFCIESDDLA